MLILFSTLVLFLFFNVGHNYKSIIVFSFLYYYLLLKSEKGEVSEEFFLISGIILSFVITLLGLNEIIFDKKGFLMFKINLYKTIITALWLFFSVCLFKSISFIPALVPGIILIISIFSYQIFFKFSFLSPNILILLKMFIGSLVPLLYLTFPSEKVIFKSADAGILGYIFGIFLVYSVNYSIVFTSLMIPVLMIIIPVMFFLIVLLFSYGKYLEQKKKEWKHLCWNVNQRSFLFFVFIFTIYFNLLGYLYFLKEYDFLYLLSFVFILILYYTGKFIFLREEKKMEFKRKVNILGIDIDNLNMKEVLEIIIKKLESIKKGEKLKLHQIVTPNSIMVYQASKNKEFMKIINQAYLKIPDGIGLFWAADFLSVPLKERVPGIDLMLNLCQISQKKGYKIYLLGSKEEVLSEAVHKLNSNYPGLKIVGYHHGYFSDEEIPSIISDINQKSPDFLFVALGSPRQEEWIFEYKNLLKVPFAIGVGGSFDVISGKLKRAPQLMQKLGLEWLYRLWQEPYRWRRIILLPLFVKEILKISVLKF